MDEKPKLKRLKELTALLNEASAAYYGNDTELVSNLEFDRLQDELADLERELGYREKNSPTHTVGSEPSAKLPKERHKKAMRSLAKTKNPEELQTWLGDRDGVLSWKLDGLTLVITYENGVFKKAVTRGNGEIGEVVSHSRDSIVNLPERIDHPGELVIRGEAVISYSEFERINAALGADEPQYKNPRNLCSGAVRRLEQNSGEKRNVRFIAFATVDETLPQRSADLAHLASLGFEVVEHKKVNARDVMDAVFDFERRILSNDLPSDGLVLEFDDIEYGRSLGSTSKFPHNAIALKWADETAETVLREIEWSASRTGMINPIAIVDPVELEGTAVSRASLHNVSVMKELRLGPGDKVKIYKANMIIPQIAENLTQSATAQPPANCPVCGEKTHLRDSAGVLTLHCTNPECPAKQLKRFAHFVSQSGMNIEGLSEMTLEKFIARGFIREYADIYRLDAHRAEIIEMDGFGERSYALLARAVDDSRRTTSVQLLYALGIPRIGLANAKIIAKHAEYDFEKIMRLDEQQLLEIHGVGGIMIADFTAFFRDENHISEIKNLLTELEFDRSERDSLSDAAARKFDGKVFVITGALVHFPNRDALAAEIEKSGGKVSGSVSKNTDFLINNDANSASTKNKKAQELGVPIITEDEFLNL